MKIIYLKIEVNVMTKKMNISQKEKNISMLAHSKDSRDSKTGYMDTGNPAQVPAKARVMRNNDNHSHE